MSRIIIKRNVSSSNEMIKKRKKKKKKSICCDERFRKISYCMFELESKNIYC